MEFSFPNEQQDPVNIPISAGLIVFIIGANGSGKSGLVHKLYAANKDHARRISAHRQTWFDSNAMNMTATNKRKTEANMLSQDIGVPGIFPRNGT